MERISSTIGKIIKQLKDKKDNDPQEKLKKHLTKKELQHIKLCNIKRQVITINVDSSAWLYAINLRKPELIQQLGVKDIRLRLGEIN